MTNVNRFSELLVLIIIFHTSNFFTKSACLKSPKSMSNLLLSTTDITFQPLEKVHHLRLTNATKIQSIGKPIMFKIKTNKIDCVDAKPSCGYISGKPGLNEITISIRSLTSNKPYTARLQILYVANDRITEEMVQRNMSHFDINEYNENYEAIKSDNQSDVKTFIINVTKKVSSLSESAPLEPQSNPNLSESRSSSKTSNAKSGTNSSSSSTFVDPKEQKKSNKSLGFSFRTCSLFLLTAFLVGLLAGFELGKRHQSSDFPFSPIQQVASSDQESTEPVIQQTHETPQDQASSQNANTETVSNQDSQSNDQDLSEYRSQEEEDAETKGEVSEQEKVQEFQQQEASTIPGIVDLKGEIEETL